MKYLFFDIDGTLLSHEEGISQSTIKALELAKENGHKIYICTGRSYAEIPERLKDFGFDGIIAAAGGYVEVGDEVILNNVMSDEAADNLMYFLSTLNIPFILEGTEEIYSNSGLRKDFSDKLKVAEELMLESQYEHAAYHYGIPGPKSLEEYFENRTPISKLTVYAENKDQLIEMKKHIDKDFDLINYGVNGEIIAKGVNKYTGIEEVLKCCKANQEDTFAFGDSLNDYDMIHSANIGVAMGNASDPVKEVSDYITTNVEDDGIYNALKHFDLI